MTVYYDYGSERQTSASAAAPTWVHTATVSNVVGVLVGFIRGGATTDNITSVSYAGTQLTRINRATDSSTEPGHAEWWFAPTTAQGQQTVGYKQGVNTGSAVLAVAVTITGDAGTPYILASAIVNDNTTSISVSLTTGYVSGLGFGAFYGGAAAPSDLSLNTSVYTNIHDFDMGAYYGKVFRKTDPFTAADGFVAQFGAAQSGDDAAFAALIVTDGSIQAGVGAVSIAGLAPNIFAPVLATALPGVGAIATAGRQPTITIPAEPVNTHEPTLLRELKQNVGLGALTIDGPVPATSGFTHARWQYIRPDPTVVSIAGRQPTVQWEITAKPGVGECLFGALAPTLTKESKDSPAAAVLSIAGLAPATLQELKVSPQQATVLTEGRQPTVTTEVGVEATASPGVGAVTIEGRAPTALPEGAISPQTSALGITGKLPAITSERKVDIGLGALSIAGQTPTEKAERTILPGVAGTAFEARGVSLETATAVTPTASAVTTQGRAPTLSGSLTVQPGVASASIQGAAPSIILPGEALDQPATAAVSISGLNPDLLKEQTLAPDAGLVSVDGLAPTLATEVTSEATIEPGVGLLVADGLIPTFPGEGRGHARTRGYSPRWDLTVSAVDAVATSVPEVLVFPPPPEFTDPPNTAALLQRVDMIEADRAARARRRREEEELIQILLRAA